GDHLRLPRAAGGGARAGGLPAAPAAGRGGRGVQPAAGVADGAGEPGAHRHPVPRPHPRGARIPAARGRPRAARLGRNGCDPVQPAPAPAGRWRPAMNAPGDWTTLVAPDALAARLGDPGLVVLDARFSLADPGAGEAGWREAHLPGARYVHLDRDLSGPHAPGAGRHPWPQAAAFARALGALGITPAHQVVAYDDADGAFAARAWCLLRMAGHARVAVLDGGLAAWRAAGLPGDAAAAPPMPAPPCPVAVARGRLFDAARVQAHLEAGGLLLDARGGERFRGESEPIDARAGHVPGAVSRPYALNLDGGRFKP